MDQEEIFIFGKDGFQLKVRNWNTENPTACICIIHGLGEHSGRYHELAEVLNKNHVNVYAIDLRGHGKNKGTKGHIKSIDTALDDIEELLKKCRAENTEIPMFLMGHSMGGNLVLNYCITKNTNELAGAIVSSPWLKLAFDPPIWKVKMGNIIAGILPSLTLDNELDTSLLSKDPAMVDSYENDNLVHSKISAGLFKNIRESASKILDNPKKIKVDSLIYHGTDDKIIDPICTEEFAAKSGKNFVSIKGAYHEPHNDLEREEVYTEILKFIKSKL
jgi:alpha-beta hydrolase superfamily lysophospholipase